MSNTNLMRGLPSPNVIPGRSRRVRFQLEQQPKGNVGLETLRRRLQSNLKLEQDILRNIDHGAHHLHQGPSANLDNFIQMN